MCQTQIKKLKPVVHSEDCWFTISNFVILRLQIIFNCLLGCPKLNLLAEHVRSISEVTPLVPQSSIFTTEMRGVNRWKRGAWNNNSDWHGWSWPTRVTLTAGSSCCPPSLPPSCLTQLMSKLGPVQSIQCGEGENTMLSFFFFFLWKAVWCYFLWDIQHENLICYVSYLWWPYCIALQDWNLLFYKNASE